MTWTKLFRFWKLTFETWKYSEYTRQPSLMAYQNKILRNPKTQQEIRFLQTAKDTGGQLLEMESTYNLHSPEPPPHYHPYQAEDFIIVSGEMTVRINGQVRVLKQGDTLHVPANTVHSMWNDTGQKAVVNWKVRPALDTEHFFETFTGLAIDGKTNDTGMPPFLQVALLVNKYDRVFRLAKPPFPVQKILFSLVTPFAYLKGYKSSYPEYLD